MDALCSYVEQLAVQNSLRLYTVSYECDHEQANVSTWTFLGVLRSARLIFDINFLERYNSFLSFQYFHEFC